jgi:hypothetical protein
MRFERIVARYMAKRLLTAKRGRGGLGRQHAYQVGFEAGVKALQSYQAGGQDGVDTDASTDRGVREGCTSNHHHG